MKVIRVILSLILSFCLILIVAIILGKSILENKILNKNYLLEKMDETEVYLQVSRAVTSGFENYIYQSGLPEDTIKDLYTEEMIKNDVNSLVNSMYEGTDIKLSDDIVRNNLNQKIDAYVESQGLKLNKQGRENIEQFEDLIIEEYKNNVNSSYGFASTLYSDLNGIINNLQKVSSLIGIWPYVALVIAIIFIVLINIKDLLSAIGYIGISSLSLGILIKMSVNLIFENFKIDNFVLFSQAMTNLVINIIKEILYGLSDKGMLFIVCGIIAIIVSAVFKSISKSKLRNE